MLFHVLGGVGLFLLGMIALTNGLRGIAGPSLRKLLATFTRTPATGAVAGAIATAVIQSSSATTVTAIGFVSAELITFPQALGVIFGANIGTTITGWFVAVLGFKLQLSEIALPVLFFGVFLKLFGKSGLKNIGWAIAGFSLLFIGIDTMKEGMEGFKGVITPESFPDDTVFGRIQLLLIGVAITLVTQSSSAGVATALVALSTGSISFTQAAAMVIGMDIGTTFTAALATVGGSTATRQTGFAHVIYNVLTGIMALFLLDPYSYFIAYWLTTESPTNAQIALVGFHTAFNTLGVIAIVPFAGYFARFIRHLIPEKEPLLIRRLDKQLLLQPASAVDAVFGTVREIAMCISGLISRIKTNGPSEPIDLMILRDVDKALLVTKEYLEQIQTDPSERTIHSRHVASVHALDHLLRLSHRCKQKQRIIILSSEPRSNRLKNLLCDVAGEFSRSENLRIAESNFNRLRIIFRKQRHSYRRKTLEAASTKMIDAEISMKRLDGVRWLHRVSYHLWRITHNLVRTEYDFTHDANFEENNLLNLSDIEYQD